MMELPMFFGLLTLLFSFESQAFATVEDENLRRMLKTRSNAQLMRFAIDRKKAQRLRLICDAQLRSERVPGTCFEFIKFDGEENKAWVWLDQLCIARAGSSRDWRELQGIAENRSVPAKCRKVASRRGEDLRYIDQAERPAEVFARSL